MSWIRWPWLQEETEGETSRGAHQTPGTFTHTHGAVYLHFINRLGLFQSVSFLLPHAVLPGSSSCSPAATTCYRLQQTICKRLFIILASRVESCCKPRESHTTWALRGWLTWAWRAEWRGRITAAKSTSLRLSQHFWSEYLDEVYNASAYGRSKKMSVHTSGFSIICWTVGGEFLQGIFYIRRNPRKKDFQFLCKKKTKQTTT